MRGLSFKDGLLAALKADTLSLTAWQIGMYGWMAIATFLIFGHEIPKKDPVFWFMMQLAMWLGFATSYPVNWWLLSQRRHSYQPRPAAWVPVCVLPSQANGLPLSLDLIQHPIIVGDDVRSRVSDQIGCARPSAFSAANSPKFPSFADSIFGLPGIWSQNGEFLTQLGVVVCRGASLRLFSK